MDEWVATAVMGWRKGNREQGDLPWYPPKNSLIHFASFNVPGYSIDWSTMEEVVEQIDGCLHLREHGEQGMWEALFCHYPESISHAETAPLAVCRAALKVVYSR
jgi:hypothetical protein